MADQSFHFLNALEPRRDSYGFALRPQHAQRYREYSNIYKEEEEERSDKWSSFLEQLVNSVQPCSSKKEPIEALQSEAPEQKVEINSERFGERVDTSNRISVSDGSLQSDPEKEVQLSKEAKISKVQTWTQIRSSFDAIENMMSFRTKKRKNIKDEEIIMGEDHIQSTEKKGSSKASEDFEDKMCVTDVLNDSGNASTAKTVEGDEVSESANTSGEEEILNDGVSQSLNTARAELAVDNDVSYGADATGLEQGMNDGVSDSVGDEGYYSVKDFGPEKSVDDVFPPELFFSWKEELESLVRGGVPKDLRGEVWQAFVGVKVRRVEGYYSDLLSQETNGGESNNNDYPSGAATKWKKQIEKDIPRTFPGHPALNEHGRNSLRRLLLAYARHKPSVGYCQAMNFFAGLLLLLMPEENAFWTLVGILDDYFEGYYTEEMIESQVDQLVFEELMRERFPKLVNHLDYLGVQVAWISGPWFLSIFVNMLPWESVLRVWDVLLFDGNRVMIFRTALALMELYGPALVTTKDAADAITLLQSLAGSTFDSSQLVLTACMGFLAVTEDRLQELREKHRPGVLVVVEERSKQSRVWKDSKGLATKLYSFKHDPGSLIEEKNTAEGGEGLARGDLSHQEPKATNIDDLLGRLAVDPGVDSLPDLQEQVVWLKVELCRLLEEKRSAVLRAEELETALMEMVQQDNRRELSARVEQLEQEVAKLHQALADKKEQEAAMLKVLMRVEHEQKVTEDARLSAEQDVAAQKYAVHVLQEKYEKAMASLADMEKRVVMAESMLEATLQYQSGQVKAQPSPRDTRNQGSMPENTRKVGLLFGLGWRDRNKGKPANVEDSGESKSTNEQTEQSTLPKKASEQEQ
ncbi:hypothetical protein UlMin_005937 [Ulmus minor]